VLRGGTNPTLNAVDAAERPPVSGPVCGTVSYHPFTFIISLFNKHVNIYDVYNNGKLVQLGFILGVGIIFAAAGVGRSKGGKRTKRRKHIIIV